MDLNTTILESIKSYPLIYPNRYTVMDHLFVTIGNGYEWENGELVSICRDPFNERGVWTPELWRKTSSFGLHGHGKNEIINQVMAEHLEKQIVELQSIVDTAEERSQDRISLPMNFYPGSINYSKICKFPPDITESWKNGIIEFHERIHQPDAEGVKYFREARKVTSYAMERLKDAH